MVVHCRVGDNWFLLGRVVVGLLKLYSRPFFLDKDEMG